jgi:broad specificity phosphatase PhoE
MRERKIVLVRHGRSSHVHAGWIDVAGFRRWREAYEAAGIVADDTPPRELLEVVASAYVVSSDIRRAMESAQLLGRPALTSPLLRELELEPPSLGLLRLPLLGWALAIGFRALTRAHGHATPSEHERAIEAARWLASLAEEHGTVVAVTHATFRSVLVRVLEGKGWRGAAPRRRSTHWSAWTLAR